MIHLGDKMLAASGYLGKYRDFIEIYLHEFTTISIEIRCVLRTARPSVSDYVPWWWAMLHQPWRTPLETEMLHAASIYVIKLVIGSV